MLSNFASIGKPLQFSRCRDFPRLFLKVGISKTRTYVVKEDEDEARAWCDRYRQLQLHTFLTFSTISMTLIRESKVSVKYLQLMKYTQSVTEILQLGFSYVWKT